MFELTLLHGPTEIKKFQKHWSRLNVNDCQIGVYASNSWLNAWLKTLTPAHKVFMISISQGDELKALVPFTIFYDELYLGTFSPFSAWLGSISTPQLWIEVLQLLETVPDWQIVYAVHCLPLISDTLRLAGWRTLLGSEKSISHIELPFDSNVYHSKLSAQTRQSIRRKMKQLAEQNIEFKVFNGEPALKMTKALTELYTNRWGQQEKRLAREFEILHSFQQHGELDLCGLMRGEQPIALMAGLRHESTKSWHAYLSAYDTNFNRFSPGLVLHNYSLQWAIKAGFTSYHFGFGDEPYKKSLSAQSTEVTTVFRYRNESRSDIPSGPSCPMPAFLI